MSDVIGIPRAVQVRPRDGDDSHRAAHSLYAALRRRLVERPDEVELLAANQDAADT